MFKSVWFGLLQQFEQKRMSSSLIYFAVSIILTVLNVELDTQIRLNCAWKKQAGSWEDILPSTLTAAVICL